MKKLIILIGVCIFAINASAQNASTTKAKMHHEKYCAMMKNGKLTMMHGSHQIMADTTLASGVMLKTDGTVVKKDGTSTMLKNGDCVDHDGNAVAAGKMKGKSKMSE